MYTRPHYPLIVAVALFFLAAPAFSANYFIDYSNGVDSAVGNTTNAPWKHCPGDPSATSAANSATLVGGDTVIFKGGITYVITAPFTTAYPLSTFGILLNFAGGNGNPITYDGNSAGTFGTGIAQISNNGSTNNHSAFGTAGGVTNVTLKNLLIGPMGGGVIPSDPGGTLYSPDGLPPNPGNGIDIRGFASNLVIASCIISNMGYNGNGFPLGGGSFAGGGFHFTSCNGVTIKDSQWLLMKDGLYFDNNSVTANLVVSNCTFGVMSEWVISLIHHTNCYCSNVFICNNLFTNTDQGIVGASWSGYNAGAYPHRDLFFMRGDETGNTYASDRSVQDTNVNFNNNYLIDTLNYLGGSAGVWFQENSTADCYNNVFVNLQHSSGALIYSEPASNTVSHTGFYNNTFYENDFLKAISYAAAPNKNGVRSYNWGVNVTNRLVDSYNNLVILYAAGNENNSFCEEVDCENTALATNVVVDYGVYRSFQSNFPGTIMVYGNWPATTTGAGFGYIQTNTGPTVGWDRHSSDRDPLVVSSTDFHLQSGSYALSAGTNLTGLSIPGLNKDYDGSARVSTGNWAIGAYGAGIFVPPTTTPVWCCR